MSQGSLYIISAPSGAGKTSLIQALLQQSDTIEVAVSHTTRTQRAGEVDGKDYHFISVAEFEAMIQQQQFLEYAKVFDNYYGTATANIAELLQTHDVILEIDWQGARQIRQQWQECLSVFILPPSKQTLLQRLQSRGQDSPDVIQRRMQQAKDEMSHYHEFDYIVVNQDFELALAELHSIFQAQGLRLAKQQIRHKTLLSALLQ